jgi:cephalosporin hydroxylase
MHFVGTINPSSVRSRSRRQLSHAFFTPGMDGDPDGPPKPALPMPESLADTYLEAYWQNQGWRRTSWLGRRVARPPADLITYHEIINEVRPNWIINTRTGDGGRAMFLASMCDVVGHGQVLSLDNRDRGDLPEHDRLHYLFGPLEGPETKQRIREITGTDDPGVLAILGTASSKRKMMMEFDLVADLVPVGSYVIFEDTIVGGHPVWPSFGPGPYEAIIDLLAVHPGFVSDTTRERFGVTFNRNGFVKRVR